MPADLDRYCQPVTGEPPSAPLVTEAANVTELSPLTAVKDVGGSGPPTMAETGRSAQGDQGPSPKAAFLARTRTRALEHVSLLSAVRHRPVIAVRVVTPSWGWSCGLVSNTSWYCAS